MHRSGILLSIFSLLFCSTVMAQNTVGGEQGGTRNPSDYRWMGHDFAFCFITDDGRTSNLAWADTARVMDFRFTIAINCGRSATNVLSEEDVQQLHADGFEIANHSLTHGFAGLPEDCPVGPRGSLMGYFLCEGIEPELAMEYFSAEIERDSLAAFGSFPVSEVKTLAYPRHQHNKAMIDSLIAEGYLGARQGGPNDYLQNTHGDFTSPPENS